MRVREAATAAVADELDDGGQGGVRPGGQREPALDRVPAEPGERHVVHLDRLERRLDGFEAGVEVVLPRLLEGLGPEGVEVLGLGGRAAVFAKFVGGGGRTGP
jgi:hypothetical protein